MKKELVEKILKCLSDTNSPIKPSALMALMAVESGSAGFDYKTGKILIQFEPHIFSEKTGIKRSEDNLYHWDENRVGLQPEEWRAFNEAFSIDPVKAMESTSIGLPQIMGFHWKRLGYTSVDAMWDDFKAGEIRQIKALIKFITTDSALLTAIQSLDWHTVALRYNGKKYREQAKRLGIVPYDQQMAANYLKFDAVYGRIN